MSKSVSAFLFFQEYKEDPNFLLTKEQEEFWANQGPQFVTACNDLFNRLQAVQGGASDVDLQTVFYDVAKAHYGTGKDDIKVFFKYIYYFLYQKNHGSRFGSMVNIMGIDYFINMLSNKLSDPFTF